MPKISAEDSQVHGRRGNLQSCPLLVILKHLSLASTLRQEVVRRIPTPRGLAHKSSRYADDLASHLFQRELRMSSQPTAQSLR